MRKSLFSFVFLSFTLFFLQPNLGFARTAKVEDVSGNVLVNGLPVEEDEIVTAGDVISTSRDDSGYMDVMLSETHKVRLKNPDAQIDSLEGTVEIQLKGGLLFSASEDEVTEDNFRVKTRQGIAGIRGTKFFLKSKPEETYICVCEGTVWFRRHGLFSYLWEDPLDIPKGYDAHIYTDEELPKPKKSPQMVERTWQVFESMGYEIPAQYK